MLNMFRLTLEERFGLQEMFGKSQILEICNLGNIPQNPDFEEMLMYQSIPDVIIPHQGFP